MKKYLLATLIIGGILCLCSCTGGGAVDSQDSVDTNQIDTTEDYQVTLAANGVNIAATGDWIFFSDSTDENKLYKIKTDGSSKEKILDTPISNIQIIGDWLYCNYKPGNNLCRMHLDGSEMTSIDPEVTDTGGAQYVEQYIVLDDWIYFVSNHEGNSSGYDGLFKMGLDGTGTIEISPLPFGVSTFYEDDGWVYFRAGAEDSGFVKLKTDGTEKEHVILEQGITPLNIIVSGDWVYFTNSNFGDNWDNYFMLFRAQKDGSELQSLGVLTQRFVISGDWIYYINDNIGLYKVKLDGTENTNVTVREINRVVKVGDDILFYQYPDSEEMSNYYSTYSVGIDSTEISEIVLH